jgi:hypothetical protein
MSASPLTTDMNEHRRDVRNVPPKAVDQGCLLNRTRRDERFGCLSLDLLGFHGG